MSARVAKLIVRLRYAIVLLWLVAAAATFLFLPTFKDAQSGSVGDLVPDEAKALDAELRSKTMFGFPLLSRTVLVEYNPSGLSVAEQARVVGRATQLNRGELPGLEGVAAALPVTNGIGNPPFARERSTTALTYLFFPPEIGAVGRHGLAERLQERHGLAAPGTFSGVTGALHARREQAELTLDALPVVELATLALVALVVGFHFRALGAAFVNLLAVGIAYVTSIRLMAWVGQKAGISVPSEIEPIAVVLIFGIITDYSIFFVSRFRRRLRAGDHRLQAAERTASDLLPIVAAAGLTVAAACAALVVADLGFFRAFGPGMAIAVLIALAVALSFVPALLAAGGHGVFWPSTVRPRREFDPERAAADAPRSVRLATRSPVIVIAGCLLVLGAGWWALRDLELENPIVRGLPADSDVRVAYERAARGFTPGVLAPTVLVVRGPAVASQTRELAQLGRELEDHRGVAAVLGPRAQPLGRPLGGALARNGDAARYVLVLDADPLGSESVESIRDLRTRLPDLLDRVGLSGTSAGLAGDTALSAETIDETIEDLKRVAPAALGAVLIVMILFLRALVAPICLLLASVAGLGAALGATVFFFQGVLGESGISYFVPFAAAVLLLSLGSDYNIFLVGRIWNSARDRPFREAVATGAARAARPITVAALVLAGSFALLALVPVQPFRHFAFAMSAGLLLDAFVVRTLLVPAVMTLLGHGSIWPRRTLRTSAPASAPALGSSRTG